MRRLGTVALVVLAVVALTTVSTSLETVSVEPTIESDGGETGTPIERAPAGPGGGGGTETATDSRETAADVTTVTQSPGKQQLPLWQVVGGLGLFVLGSLLALYGLTRGTDVEDPGTEEVSGESTHPPPDQVTLGADVPATNDVYRVWNALSAEVPLEPAGETPAAVAEAAIAAGYRPEPVIELTDLFCAIRYGEKPPTPDRQQRARALATTLSLEDEP